MSNRLCLSTRKHKIDQERNAHIRTNENKVNRAKHAQQHFPLSRPPKRDSPVLNFQPERWPVLIDFCESPHAINCFVWVDFCEFHSQTNNEHGHSNTTASRGDASATQAWREGKPDLFGAQNLGGELSIGGERERVAFPRSAFGRPGGRGDVGGGRFTSDARGKRGVAVWRGGKFGVGKACHGSSFSRREDVTIYGSTTRERTRNFQRNT